MLFPKLLLLLPLVVPPQPLAEYQDHSRVLVVFAPSRTDARYHEQIRTVFRGDSDLNLRDVVLVQDVFKPDHRKTTDLRKRFHISRSEFTVILVGKDGGEKLRQHTPISLEKIVAIIDAMPRRQQEMKDRTI